MHTCTSLLHHVEVFLASRQSHMYFCKDNAIQTCETCSTLHTWHHAEQGFSWKPLSVHEIHLHGIANGWEIFFVKRFLFLILKYVDAFGWLVSDWSVGIFCTRRQTQCFYLLRYKKLHVSHLCKWLYERSYIWTAEKDMTLWLIIAVIHTTYAVVKLKPERKKFRPKRDLIFIQALISQLLKLCV